MDSSDVSATELLRLLEMKMEFTAENRDFITGIANAYLAASEHTAEDQASAKFLVEALFRFGSLSLASRVARQRLAEGGEATAFDHLAIHYTQLSQLDLRMVEACSHVPLYQAEPPRPAERPRVLSFLFTAPSFQGNGYTVRTQAILENTELEVIPHTKIGFPWTANMLRDARQQLTSTFEGLEYHHRRGGLRNQNETITYLTIAKHEIKKVIAEQRPDVIHAASNFTVGLPALLAARECRLPFVYEMRGIWELTAGVGVAGWQESERFQLERRLESFIASQADRVITLTDTQGAELVARGIAAEKVHVVPNCFEGDHGDGAEETPFLDKLRDMLPGGPVIGYAGSIVNYEGLQDLVEVLARNNAALRPVTLLILGDGPYLPELKALVERRQLGKRVLFTGRVPKQDAEAAYRLFDLCVLPRLDHAVAQLVSPLKLIEILAKGKVLLVSDVSAMAERVKATGFGEMFRSGDRDDLEAQLVRILGQLDELKEHYAAARPYILNNFTWASGAKLWDATARAAWQDWARLAPTDLGKELALDHTRTLAPPGVDSVQAPCTALQRVARARLPGAAAGQLVLALTAGEANDVQALLFDPASAAGEPIEQNWDVADDGLARCTMSLVGMSEGSVYFYLPHGLANAALVEGWVLTLQPPDAEPQRLKVSREADRILAFDITQAAGREESVEFHSAYPEAVRFAMSVIPRPNAKLGAGFTKMQYSDPIGAKFQYVRVEPKNSRLPLKTGVEGRLRVEFTPWQDGYRRAANQLAATSISWQVERSASYLLRLPGQKHNVLVVAQLNENLIDGSAIWLKTLVGSLAASPDVNVFVASNAILLPTSISAPMFSRPNVVKLDLGVGGADEAIAAEVQKLDRVSGGFDTIIVRGAGLARQMNGKAFRDRLVIYSVGLIEPEHVEDGRYTDAEAILALSRSAGLIFQSQTTRDIFLRSCPGYTGKCFIIPPSVDAEDQAAAKQLAAARPAPPGRHIVYAGKMIREYGVLELLAAVRKLRRLKTNADIHLVLIGNKFDNTDLDFQQRFREGLAALGQGVTWIAAASPIEVLAWVQQAQAVWGWRHAEFETSHLEVSTKMVEALSSGSPIVLYPSPAAVKLLGVSYSGFAKTPEQAETTLRRLLTTDKKALGKRFANRFSNTTTYHPLVEHAAPAPRGLRILAASHDFKFFDDIEGQLLRHGNLVHRQTWRGHHELVPLGEAAVLPEVDLVFCEWCLGNAVWWSNNLPEGKRLIIRYHSQETFTEYPGKVDWARVEKLLFVSPFIMRQAQAKFGIPPELCEVVPIQVGFATDHRFTPAEVAARRNVLGLVGITPWLKRLDRALELTQRLRTRHPEIRLLIKGKTPSAYPWMKNRPDELEKYQALFRELSGLRDSGVVEFCGFDDNMEAFYRRCGWVLSMSDWEGCHTAVAEGGIVGCLPLIGFWQGGNEVYPPRYSGDSLDSIEALFEQSYPRFAQESRAIQQSFIPQFSLPAVFRRWAELFGAAVRD